jgi:cell division protein FtsB
MAMQDQKKALESENENLKQRIDQLESEQDYNQSRGGAVMNNYVDDMGNKSYLSSEMM